MLRALAQSGRVSNLPTVWTNVLVGAAAAGWAEPGLGEAAWRPFVLAIVVISLLYLGGMFLNDAIDADWDRAHGKDRPIPRGELSRATAYGMGFACMIAAGLLTLMFGFSGVTDSTVMQGGMLLGGSIVVYDLLHKRTALAVLVMGACRAMVYAFAASLVVTPETADWVAWQAGEFNLIDAFGFVLPMALAVFVYTVLLTLAARREDIAGARIGGLWAWAVPVPYLCVACVFFGALWTSFVGVAFVVWSIRSARLARAGRIPDAVSGWIAGICLADAFVLMLLNRLDLAGIALACWLITVVGQKWIAGT